MDKQLPFNVAESLRAFDKRLRKLLALYEPITGLTFSIDVAPGPGRFPPTTAHFAYARTAKLGDLVWDGGWWCAQVNIPGWGDPIAVSFLPVEEVPSPVPGRAQADALRKLASEGPAIRQLVDAANYHYYQALRAESLARDDHEFNRQGFPDISEMHGLTPLLSELTLLVPEQTPDSWIIDICWECHWDPSMGIESLCETARWSLSGHSDGRRSSQPLHELWLFAQVGDDMSLEGRRVTVDEYHAMVARGDFAADDRFELLENTIVRRRRQTPAHCCTRELLCGALRPILRDGWHLRQRSGFTTQDSEPEPDVVVTRGNPLDYIERHPAAVDAVLVVEIKTAEMQDLETRLRVYRRAGVAMIWVIDVDRHEVAVFEHHAGGTKLGRDDSLPNLNCLKSARPLIVGDFLPQ